MSTARLGVAYFGLAALMCVLAGCGSTTRVAGSTRAGGQSANRNANARHTASSVDRSGSRIEPEKNAAVRINLPADASSSPILATQRGSAGVWVYDTWRDTSNNSPTASIWHYDPATGATRTWPIGHSGDALGGVTLPALAACANATYFGSNRSLFQLDPSNGVVTTFSIPAPGALSPAQQVPPGVKPSSGINSLSCGPDGAVVIATNADASVYVFHPSTMKFTSIALPPNSSVTQVAADEKGQAVVGLYRYAATSPGGRQVGHPTEVAFVDVNNGKLGQVRTVASSRLIARVPGGFRASSITGSTFLSPDGTIAKHAAYPTSGGAGRSGGDASFLPDGRFVFAGGKGLVVIDPSQTDHQATVGIATVPCGGHFKNASGGLASAGQSSTPPETIPPGTACPVGADAIAVDDKANVYVVPTAGSPTTIMQVNIAS